MSLIKILKKSIPSLPYPIGNLMAKVPYGCRPMLAKVYRQRVREINKYPLLTPEQSKEFIFTRVRKVVEYAYENVTFYRSFYGARDFHPSHLNEFDDLKKIPIICKRDLAPVDLEERTASNYSGGQALVNTGGSTGSPLSLYIQTDSYGHEKAHIDHVWSKLGYTHRDSILTFSGRSKLKSPIQYDGLRHAFMVDIYKPMDQLANALEELIKRNRMPRFLHGYPSAIFDFLAQLEQTHPRLTKMLNELIDGSFFGSEFPNPQWRERIESTTGAGSVSWYGHTERCVLAYEANQPFEFAPLQTYGYAESVDTDAGEQLVGTSYYNFVCPMIRYNTEDGIEAIDSSEGILRSFKILDGRVGEYVMDRNGKKIPLTGLIYGRHHRLFDYCRSLQISQTAAGKATIHYSVLPNSELPSEAASIFDSSGVEIDFSFEEVAEPIRTVSGKVTLLVANR